MKNYVFYNVDTQVDFIEPTGKLYISGAEIIKPILAKLTKFASDNQIDVINSCDWHKNDSPELSVHPDFITTFPEHCMQNSAGAEFIAETQVQGNVQHIYWDKDYPQLAIESGNVIIYKDRFDVFSGNKNSEKLFAALRDKGVQTIYVYGVATNVCVAYAVLGLAARGFNVCVIGDALRALPNLLDPLPSWQNGEVAQVKVLSSDEVLAYLANQSV